MLISQLIMNFLNKIKFEHIFQLKTVLALLIIFSLTALLAYIRVNSGYALAGDTGQLYLILENIHAGNGPINPWQASILDFVFSQNMLTLDASKLCKMDFESANYEGDDLNHFKFHLYLILYPASLFLYLIDAPYVAHGLNILSFLLFLFVSYKITRKNKIPFFISILAIITISLHPAWSWSIIGQPYVDRMFLPLGLLLFYYTDNREGSFKAMLFVLAISVMIVEKAIVYSGIFIITYSILFYKDYFNKKDLIRRLLVGITLLIIFIIITKLYLKNLYYTTSIPNNIEGILNIFLIDRSFNGVKSLLMVNAPLLLPAIIFRPRIFLIAFVMLLPNIVGNIGGAEKTGYHTHYHTLYFPFIVYAFIHGIGGLFRWISIIKAEIVFSIFLIITALFYLLIDFDDEQNIKFTKSPATYFYATNFYNMSKDLTNYKNITTLVESNIPLNAKISSVEAGWAYLYKFKNLVIFPMDFEKTDFLLVGYEKINNNFNYSGYQGFLGPNHSLIVNECLDSRIRKAGYDVEFPILLSPSLAILKRNIPSDKLN